MCVYLVSSETKQSTFSLQWHLTAKCDQRCKHCYMYDSDTYKSELENELSFEQCKDIINDFAKTLNVWNKMGSIAFTGGDPLLREDFFDILDYARQKGVFPIVVAGNSYHINKLSAKRLKECGVLMYQISLDGLKETHDCLRRQGSFEDTIRAYRILKDEGIKSACMMTVSKLNMNEIIEVINLAAKYELDAFDFDRLVPSGCGKNLMEEMIDPEEYRELLINIRNEYSRLKSAGCKTQFGFKDSLWSLLIEENDMKSSIVPQGFELLRGCSIGISGLAVLADGSVMACRRLPVVIGKLPEQKIADIFENSPTLNKFRDIKKIDICGNCKHISDCRGCRAVAYGYSDRNYFTRDPQCWVSTHWTEEF